MTEQRSIKSLSRRDFALGSLAAVGAPAIVRAQGLTQGLTKVKITQPSESLSYMPIYL